MFDVRFRPAELSPSQSIKKSTPQIVLFSTVSNAFTKELMLSLPPTDTRTRSGNCDPTTLEALGPRTEVAGPCGGSRIRARPARAAFGEHAGPSFDGRRWGPQLQPIELPQLRHL